MGGSASKATGFRDVDLTSGLLEGKFQNIVIMCGAGISTSAGIPDFRSPSAGLYFKLRKYNLPYPEAVFEGSYFRTNPLPFYGLIRELFPSTLTPTTTHKFFSLLHQKGILRRIYTQNIDALEYLAGVPEEKIIEAHGSFQKSYCTKCKKSFDLKWLKKEIFTPESNDGVPKCVTCNGVVRPDVVLFGEPLPSRFWENIDADFHECDLLLVLGTSLVVSPFNTLVGKPRRSVPRCYINLTKPGNTGTMLGWLMNMGANVDFSRDTDLVLLGDCDNTVRKLADKVDWKEDLEKIAVTSLEDTLT